MPPNVAFFSTPGGSVWADAETAAINSKNDLKRIEIILLT
jgi:hypothetical protein